MFVSSSPLAVHEVGVAEQGADTACQHRISAIHLTAIDYSY